MAESLDPAPLSRLKAALRPDWTRTIAARRVAAGALVVLVPALAVDRRGVRLGRGAGFYDRSLTLARPDTPLIAVVRDDELLDRLPAEPHDVRMTHALTPQKGLVDLGISGPHSGSST